MLTGLPLKNFLQLPIIFKGFFNTFVLQTFFRFPFQQVAMIFSYFRL